MPALDKYSLPVLLPAVLEKLVGYRKASGPVAVADVSVDGSSISVRLSENVLRRHWEEEIAPESREFAIRLRRLLCQLIRDGAEPGSVAINLGEEGWPIAKPRRKRRGRQVDTIRCDLRHGLQLTVWKSSDELRIQSVGDFLAQAMKHFKEEMADEEVDLYSGGPYYVTVKDRGTMLGRLQLSCLKEEWLKPALWVDAVIAAYVNVNMVEDMLKSLPEWQKASLPEDSCFREVVGLLEKPGGEFAAMAAMLRLSLAKKIWQPSPRVDR